jgi:pimeloyl-ACP methyl ester carboxylesterase
MWWLLLPAGVYLAILATLFFAQTAILFPTGQVGPAGALPEGTERLVAAAASGERLHGVHIPPAAPPREPLLVIGFGGNAWNAEAMAAYLHDLYPEADIVAFHYRGYRPSEGAPGAAALLADAPLVLDAARERVRPTRTVAVGFSVGGGVAAGLATQRPLDGLILVTPFDSLGSVAAGHYPWLPVRALLMHRMEPAADLAGSQVPVAILAGARDTLIPPARTDALRRIIPNLVSDRTLAGAGHNDIYQRADFHAAMRDALARILVDRERC